MGFRPAAFDRKAAWSLCALLLLVVGVHATGIGTPPFTPDSLGAIDQTLKSDAAMWLEPTSSHMPFYRPLPFWTMKLQIAAAGLHVPMLLLTNVLLLAVLFAALHAIARRLGASPMVAAAVLGVVAVDAVWQIPQLWLSDRQALFALVLGWLAVLALIGEAGWPRVVLAALALCGAALSKETGYTFVPALLWLAWIHREHRWSRVAVLLAVALGLLAWRAHVMGGLIHGTRPAPTDIGFLFEHRVVQYSALSLSERLPLHAWNIAANLLGVFYRPLFDSVGAINPAGPVGTPGDLVFALLAGGALIAIFARPRAVAPLLLVILGNALVGFTEYRARNHLPGFAGMGALAAIGLSVAVADRRWPRRIAVAACALLVVVGAARTVRSYQSTAESMLAEYRRLGDVPGPDLRLGVLKVAREYCAATPRWCVIDREALRRVGLI